MYIYTYQCLFQMGYSVVKILHKSLSTWCFPNNKCHEKSSWNYDRPSSDCASFSLYIVSVPSRKHFKPKPKRSHGNVSTEQSEFQPEFTISVPLKLYADAPVKSIGSSQSRGYTIRYVNWSMYLCVICIICTSHHLGTFMNRME